MFRIVAFVSLLFAPTSLFAGGIHVEDPYARASRPGAPTGAIFMVIHNMAEVDDTLVDVSSDVAAMVEIHTHIDAGNGVMQMRPVEGGITIPANGMHALKRGGDHVMLMGLNWSLETGDSLTLTLTFEGAGDVLLEVPVDNERMDMSDHNGHSAHSN